MARISQIIRYGMQRVVTLGPVGYSCCPGTVASIVTLTSYMGLWHVGCSEASIALLVGIILVFAVIMIEAVLPLFYTHDPAPIVIDEVIGMMVALLWLPHTWWIAVGGFILFRFFDVTKIAGIGLFERLPGAWGIIADDLFAGIYANIILRAMVLCYSHYCAM